MSYPSADYRGDSSDRDGQAISELIRRTVDYAVKNYAKVLPIFLAAGVIDGVVFVLFLGPTSMPNVPSNYASLTQSQMLSIASQAAAAIGYTWIEYLISALILYFAAGIAIWQMATREDNLQNASLPTSQPIEPTIGYGGTGKKLPLNYAKLAVTTFVSVLLISLGLFLVLVGAIVLGVMFYLVLPSTVLEGRSAGSSLSRSRQLVSGRWFKTFALLAGWLLFVYIVSGFLGAVTSFALPSTNTANIIATFVQNFALALLFPFIAASMLVLYDTATTSSSAALQRGTQPAQSTSPYDFMKPEPMWPKTSSIRFCPNCGANLLDHEKYCHNCGRALGV